MKKVTIILGVLMVLVSCENPVSKKIKEVKQDVSNTTEAFEEISNMQEDIEALQDVDPLTKEQMKAWLPEELNGMKRIGYKTGQGSFMNIAMIEGTYANEDKSKKLKIELIDGAGKTGATATAGMRIMFSQEMEEETETKSMRTLERNGAKAIEEYRKNSNTTEIQLMQGDRFYIKVKGTKMNVKETWDAIDDFNLEDLG